MIAGLIIEGTQPKQVLITVNGATLADHGVPNVLANPTLSIHDASGQQIAFNDDWREGADAGAIEGIGMAPNNAQEPALLMTLQPGAYTAIVRGVNDTTGNALVNVYDLE